MKNNILIPGGHGHISYYTLQFGQRYHTLTAMLKPDDFEGDDKIDDPSDEISDVKVEPGVASSLTPGFQEQVIPLQ